MARSDFLAIAIIVAVLVLAVTCDEEKPKTLLTTKCWKCSSDSKDSAFCNDPFDASQLTAAQNETFYIDCPTPPNRPNNGNITQSNQKVVCRKLKTIQNDTVVIHRACLWQELHDEKKCENENLPSHIKVESCTLCSYGDGCNHSPRIAIEFGRIVTILAIPLAIAKIFSF